MIAGANSIGGTAVSDDRETCRSADIALGAETTVVTVIIKGTNKIDDRGMRLPGIAPGVKTVVGTISIQRGSAIVRPMVSALENESEER